MARVRTQKVVSRRIDLAYIARPHPLRTGRKVLAFLAGLIAIAFVTFYSIGKETRLHNPGHLTSAHAAFETDCAKCHVSQENGRISREVADSSCIRCHDGAVHHPNQLDNTLVKVGGGLAMSKDCVSCHSEHRGQEALISKNDATCTSCHANIDAHAKVPPDHAKHVTAFSLADHPRFGNELMKDGKMFDPTPLKYNHAKHNKQPLLANNCTACHSTTPQPAHDILPINGNPPPYRTDKDAIASRTDPRAMMQPISYAKDCIGCHPIQLPPDIAIPHEDLAKLRPYFAGLAEIYRQKLASIPDKSSVLVTTTTEGRPPKKVTKAITEQAWIEKNIADIGTLADRDMGKNPDYLAAKKAGPTSQPASVPNTNAVEYYVTYGVSSKCVLCHEMSGSLAPATALSATPSTRPSTSSSAMAAASARPRLPRTVPTGITESPRVWFSKSHFDHDAHRAVTCLDCHAAALTSEKTSDILSPDIDTVGSSGASCISCHKPETTSLFRAATSGAQSNCITCHSFHDRTLEPPGLVLNVAPSAGAKTAPAP